MQEYSIYLHIPFCHHRCSYCDFNTYSGIEELIPAYSQALCAEIKFIGANNDLRLPVHTVFFGGGTPSILPITELNGLLEVLREEVDLIKGAEITLEANPERLSFDYLQGLHEMGINRLSLGMQSANPEDLQLLERQHDYRQVTTVVKEARKAGIDNINIDLIFGIPHQTLSSWQKSLEFGLSLEPDHLSLYALTVEKGTPLAGWVTKGLLVAPDPDLAADMYEWASERLDQSGYKQYEISNWARFDTTNGLLVCKHNLQYWRNLSYIGFGAGAHGFSGGKRTANVRLPYEYIQRIQNTKGDRDRSLLIFPSTPATDTLHVVDREEEMRETMMMGLRLTGEGISRSEFRSRFHTSIEEEFNNEIEELLRFGLLEWKSPDNDRLRLTPRGRLLGNQVFIRFV